MWKSGCWMSGEERPWLDWSQPCVGWGVRLEGLSTVLARVKCFICFSFLGGKEGESDPGDRQNDQMRQLWVCRPQFVVYTLRLSIS